MGCGLTGSRHKSCLLEAYDTVTRVVRTDCAADLDKGACCKVIDPFLKGVSDVE